MVIVCAVVAYGSIWFQQQEDAREAAARPESYAPGERTPIPAPDGVGPVEEAGSLDARLEALEEEVEVCLESWWMLDPALSGEVLVGISLAPEGLEEAWIEDHVGVPAGPLACFSAAVWELDREGLAEGPMKLTVPLHFDPTAPG